jgi:hypothetical protein
MATREVLAAIEQRVSQRAARVYAARGATIVPASTIADCFEELANALRDEATGWETAKRKGWQSKQKELRQLAALIAGVALDIRALPADETPTPDRASEVDGFTDGSALAYLSGQTDALPPPVTAVANGTEVMAVAVGSADAAATIANQLDAIRDEIAHPNATPAVVQEIAPMTQTFPLFSDPPAPAVRLTLGPRWTYEDLMSGTPGPPVDRDGVPYTHWSWSQLEETEDCGLKYRLQRVERLPQVPQWALIGGSTFHACVEALERNAPATVLPELNELWDTTFHGFILETAKSTALPMDQWRASSKGAEGYTWWREAGVDMLKRYVDWRGTLAMSDRLVINGEPVIEYETTLDVAGVQVKMVIDAAYRQPDGTILVVDYKTGKSTGDSAQLGLYAHAIVQALGAQYQTERIYGFFYNARTGTPSEVVDLLTRHPFSEYVYRFHTAEAARQAALYRPRKSSFCGGCAVRYVCPAWGS